MIGTMHFAIGFIIFIGFNMLTFRTYSKKPGITKKFILLTIFSFYSLLALYVINFVETYNGSPLIEIIIQSLIFLVAGTIFLYFVYSDIIKSDNLDVNDDMNSYL